MKLFRCDHCGNTLYFENGTCESCGHRLGYLAADNDMVSLDPANGGGWASPTHQDRTYIFCANAKFAACNWLVEVKPGGELFCAACRHNETIPSLNNPQNLGQWQTIERAKKRLFYSLIKLNLPLHTRNEDPAHGLSFRFLADGAAAPSVMTGHENGIVTIALAEANDAERELRRTTMGEPYRTLLGHFRHEIGHHYWDLLVDNGPHLEECRAIFGDDRQDYGEALQRHYAQGAPPNWPLNYISSYATAHPWEDFAETWAHYLHITDTVETAAAYDVKLHPSVDETGELSAEIHYDPYKASDVRSIVDNLVPLSSLLNNLNRSMGQADAYPFVLSLSVVAKLAFIHRLVHSQPMVNAA